MKLPKYIMGGEKTKLNLLGKCINCNQSSYPLYSLSMMHAYANFYNMTLKSVPYEQTVQ